MLRQSMPLLESALLAIGLQDNRFGTNNSVQALSTVTPESKRPPVHDEKDGQQQWHEDSNAIAFKNSQSNQRQLYGTNG
jgi:hypothetical protein